MMRPGGWALLAASLVTWLALWFYAGQLVG